MPIPIIPFVIGGLAGGGLGAFFGAQADDAIEVATGEKPSTGMLPLMLTVSAIAVGIYYMRSRK